MWLKDSRVGFPLLPVAICFSHREVGRKCRVTDDFTGRLKECVLEKY